VIVQEGNFLYKQDYPDRLVKVPTNMPVNFMFNDSVSVSGLPRAKEAKQLDNDEAKLILEKMYKSIAT